MDSKLLTYLYLSLAKMVRNVSVQNSKSNSICCVMIFNNQYYLNIIKAPHVGTDIGITKNGEYVYMFM